MSEQQARAVSFRVRDLAKDLIDTTALDAPRIGFLALAHALGAFAFTHFPELDREEALQLALKEARRQLRHQEAKPAKGAPR